MLYVGDCCPQHLLQISIANNNCLQESGPFNKRCSMNSVNSVNSGALCMWTFWHTGSMLNWTGLSLGPETLRCFCGGCSGDTLIYTFPPLQLLPRLLCRILVEFLWFWSLQLGLEECAFPILWTCHWKVLGSFWIVVSKSWQSRPSRSPFFTVTGFNGMAIGSQSCETGESLILLSLPFWRLERWLLERFTTGIGNLILLGVRIGVFIFVLDCILAYL